jgi:hypothetical protein
MGGVLSASAVALAPSSAEDMMTVSRAMLHTSVVGGCTLAIVNWLR